MQTAHMRPSLRIRVLSWSPRAFVYHNFLSRDEIRHILNLSALVMKRSMVVGSNDTGVVDSIRTSAGTFINRNWDPVITTIENRLAVWSHLPPENQEDMQVLRYGPTNKYGPHIDGLGRVMSVLIYLIEPTFGGETAFASTQTQSWLHPEMGEKSQGKFSDCAKGHVAYRPKRGDAIMFYDQLPDYKQEDAMSMHTGCPVVEGVKWNAVKWIHGVPFRGEDYKESLGKKHDPLPDPGMCTNRHEMCEQWAAAGECQKNSGYMKGGDGEGQCRLACKDCKVCSGPKDMECIKANRNSGGFINFEMKEEFGDLWDGEHGLDTSNS